ncbi:MAG: PAS domain S-box protein [Desulfosalsimonadaceae bacterium]
MPRKPTYEELEKRILELEPAEASLRASEARFRAMIERSPMGIAIVNNQFQYTYVNNEFCNIAGYPEEEIIGANFFFLLAEESKQLAIERYTKRQRGESVPDRYEISFIKKTGDCRIGEVQSTVFMDVDGHANSLLQAYDITDRKLSEEALQASKQKYRVLVENSGEAIFVAQGGKLKYVNPATETTIGYPKETLTSRMFTDFIHPDDRAMVLDRHFKRMKGEDTPSRYAFRIMAAGKDTRWVELNVVAIEWEGQPATLNFLSDITARRQADAEKSRLQNLLNQAQKMESVGRLAGGVAHDFNNMLGVILGHAELALKKSDPDLPIRNSIKEIQRAAQRSADLTRQLLAFVRKQTISPKQLFLNETVGGMITMLRRLIGEDIHLIWMPGPDLWPVKMDPAQVDQILANLCVNARDAIHDKSGGVGNIAIKTENIHLDETFCANQEDAAPGDYVLLEVSDDGCGMAQAVIDKLFEPFFTTKDVGKGTGLGLATIYGIVRQNNGTIRVLSRIEAGTTFDIYIPRDTGTARPHDETRQEKPAGGAETILVVEDEPAILDMARLMLENMGYRLLTAGSPADAIRIAESHPGPIDLLITDVIMPEMNGRDLARRLASLYPGIKPLFMSGHTADVIAHRGVLDKNVHFIQKPFSMDELAAGVRKALEKRQP